MLLQAGGRAAFCDAGRPGPAETGRQLQQASVWRKVANYTRLDDSPERIINTRGRPMSGRRRVADAGRESTAARAIGRLMTRGPLHFRGLFQQSATQCQRLLTPTVFITAPAI